MRRLFLIAPFLAIIAVAISSFSGASLAADASPKTSAAPESSSADDPSWKEYKKLLENYLFLDKQKAGHISCSVSVPATQGLIDNARRKGGGMFIIDENLHDFSVTYDRIKGLSFNSPHIKFSFPSEAKPADVERLENLRERLENVFYKNIDGAKKIITKLHSFLIPLSPENYKILSLTKNGNATVVSLDDDKNDHFRIIYSGSTQEGTYSSPTSNGTYTLDYQPLNGKLAVIHFVGDDTQDSTKTNSTISVSYQDLGSAFFPAQILADGTISEGIQQSKTGHIEIDFKDCKTSDLSP